MRPLRCSEFAWVTFLLTSNVHPKFGLNELSLQVRCSESAEWVMLAGLDNRRVIIPWLAAVSALLVWGTAFGGRSFGPIRAVLVALPYGDKVGHFGLYGAIAMALGLLVSRRSHMVAVGLAVIVIGLADEFRQLSEGNRNFSAADVLANLAGISVGLLVALAIRRMRPSNVTGGETQLYKV